MSAKRPWGVWMNAAHGGYHISNHKTRELAERKGRLCFERYEFAKCKLGCVGPCTVVWHDDERGKQGEKMTSAEYRKLCRSIHKEFGKKLGLSYFHSCELVDDVYFRETTEEKLRENLTEALDGE